MLKITPTQNQDASLFFDESATKLGLRLKFSEKAKERILKSRPPLLFEKDKIKSLKVGNINDDCNCFVNSNIDC